MAESIDRHTPAHQKAAEGIDRHRADESRPGDQRGGGGIYQKYWYIKFRERVKARRRARDEKRVHEIYEDMETRSFRDYINFLQSGDPLCVDCLEEGVIKPGRVMDHITPIEQGGSITDPDNLAFRCDHHHNVKRATEDKQ